MLIHDIYFSLSDLLQSMASAIRLVSLAHLQAPSRQGNDLVWSISASPTLDPEPGSDEPPYLLLVVCCLVAQSCPTLCNPMDYSPPGSSVHGIFFPGKNTGVGCHFLLQGISPTQGLYPGLLPDRWILYHLATWEAHLLINHMNK